MRRPVQFLCLLYRRYVLRLLFGIGRRTSPPDYRFVGYLGKFSGITHSSLIASLLPRLEKFLTPIR